jgi:hypothetical protein
MDAGHTEDGAPGGDAMLADGSHPSDAPGDGDLPDSAGRLDGSDRSDAGDPFALLREYFCAPIARATCRARVVCGCAEAELDVDACIAEEADACAVELSTSGLGEALRSGAVTVDGEAAERCAARAEASLLACSGDRFDVFAFCYGIFIDVAPLGGRCTSFGALLCAGGEGYCDVACEPLPARGAPCAPPFGLCARGLLCRHGICADLGATGAPCGRDSECADELLCVGGRCGERRIPIGGGCTDTDECVVGARCTAGICRATERGGACRDDRECGALEECAVREELRCSPRGMVGEPCAHLDGCVPEAFCDRDTSVCRLRPGVGEPCTVACVAGAACGPDGRCHLLGSDGEPCVPSVDSDGCLDGLACVSGVCRAPPGPGEACADDGECAPGLACFFEAGGGEPRCASEREPGERCLDAVRGDGCRPESFCDPRFDVCMWRRGAGEPCEGGDCERGLACRVDDMTGEARCGPIPGLGERCTDTCEEGAICSLVPVARHCERRICESLL